MLFFLFIQTVAYAQFIGNIIMLAFSRFVAKLSADIGHVDLQSFNAALLGVISPDCFDDCGIGHHFSAVLRKKCNNIIFGLGEFNGFPFHTHLPCIVIDMQIVEDELPPGKRPFSVLKRLFRSAARTRASNSPELKGFVT